MSTTGRIDPYRASQQISPIRAAAITLSCGPRVKHNPSMNVLYDMASEQATTIVTDVPMADTKHLNLTGGRDRVIASFTGKDAARSAWARLVSPQQSELRKNPALHDTKDRIERLTREVNFHLLQEDLIHTEVFFGRSHDYMGKINFIVPSTYAKLAYDLNLNFYRSTPEYDHLYARSRELSFPDLWLVCHPDWVNPVWEAWRTRTNPTDPNRAQQDPEPKRIIMMFDVPFHTAYLLGARYFGEIKKACLTMIWDAAVNAGIGMPIHGSSKTIYIHSSSIRNTNTPESTPVAVPSNGAEPISSTSSAPAKANGTHPSEPVSQSVSKTRTKKSKATPSSAPSNTSVSPTEPTVSFSSAAPHETLVSTTFITIGLSGSGKSTIGNDPHLEYLSQDKGEHVHIGNDDALLILTNPSQVSAGTIGLEYGCYNKSNDYTPDSFYIRTVQSAENVMVARDEHYRLFLIHQDVLSGNGRVQTARHLLPGAGDDINTPWPDYISLLMKDETLPPLMRVQDPALMVSMFMSLATKSSTAENIPVEQMNKLKMVPGANPFNTWGMQQEAEALERTLQIVRCHGLVMNTGGFFINRHNNERSITRKVTKELSLSIYPKLAQHSIKWVPWSHFPGMEIPHPDSFADVYPFYERDFSPYGVEDVDTYLELLRQRLLQRQNFLLNLGIDRRFILPIRKAIIQIDDHELATRGRASHVDNIDTYFDTGRDLTSLL